MKLLVYVLIISLHYCTSNIYCNLDDGDDKKVAVKQYPKKVKAGLIQIHNAGKYVKPKTKPSFTKKGMYKKTALTVFPNVFDGKRGIPDSPYFPLEKLPEQKSRVKKVLSENDWISLRRKRSVDDQDIDTRRKGEEKTVHVKSPALRRRDGRHKLSKKSSKKGQKIRKNKRMKRTGSKKLRKGAKRTRNGKRRNHKRPKNAAHRRNPAGLISKLGKEQATKVIKGRRHFLQSKKGGRRLIAARDALIEDYPYVVSIQKDKQHWCAGALLNPKLVITTANCLWKSNRMSHMRVRAGSRYTDRGGEVANIQEVMKHPGWKLRTGPDHDIALVLLDRNIKFSHGVHGVDLPNRAMMPPFEDAWITSWGTERRDGIYEPKGSTLQVYHGRILDRAKCNNVTLRFGVAVSDNFICIAQTGKRGPCTRDTGAPAVSDGVLWGLASWGIRKRCGTERFPAMFSYLASQTNMDFIINATHYLMADERYYPFPDRPRVMRAGTVLPNVKTY